MAAQVVLYGNDGTECTRPLSCKSLLLLPTVHPNPVDILSFLSQGLVGNKVIEIDQ